MSRAPMIEIVLTALREFGGYFVWRAEDGQEYVITSRQEFETRTGAGRDLQLGLLERSPLEAMPARWTADDMLEKINRDLALYQLQHDDDMEALEVEEDEAEPRQPFDFASTSAEATAFDSEAQARGADKQGKRVRFEPLRGDLPPSLQE